MIVCRKIILLIYSLGISAFSESEELGDLKGSDDNNPTLSSRSYANFLTDNFSLDLS